MFAKTVRQCGASQCNIYLKVKKQHFIHQQQVIVRFVIISFLCIFFHQKCKGDSAIEE